MSEAERTQENQPLKLGYFAALAERYPFNTDPKECLTAESATLLHLETQFLEIPPTLDFTALETTMAIEHRGRIQKIREKLEECRTNYANTAQALITHWRRAPKTRDEEAEREVTTTTIHVRKNLAKAAVATIADPQKAPEPQQKERIKTWQTIELALRRQLLREQKLFMFMLRLYWEMLLERPKGTTKDDPDDSNFVLQKNHPARREIIRRNRYARVLQAVYQGLNAAKAFHDKQEEGRLRKTERIPYWFHLMGVVGRCLKDVAPYILEEEKLTLDIPTLIIIAGLHDTREDTGLEISTIIGNIMRIGRIDDEEDSGVDTRINDVIHSGYPDVTQDEIKKRCLNLLKSSDRSTIETVLQILSKNEVLSAGEIDRALRQNIAGWKGTKAILKTARTIKQREEPSKTFSQFPETTEEKMDLFLIKLNALTTPAQEERRQISLIVKCADREHNISTQAGRRPEKQLQTLRSTTTRLIAWCMLDHDRTAYPLYNILPRLIDTTLNAYEALTTKPHQASITDQDRINIDRLKEWQKSVERWPEHAPFVENLAQYNRAIARRRRMTKTAVSELIAS